MSEVFEKYAGQTALIETEKHFGKLPGYVQRQTEEDESKFAASAFALPALKQWPIYDASSTFKSAAAYFGNYDVKDVQICARIKAAAVTHGIEADVDKVEALFDNMFAMEKSASDDVPANPDLFILNEGTETTHTGHSAQDGPSSPSLSIPEGAQRKFKLGSHHEVLDSDTDLADGFYSKKISLKDTVKAAQAIRAACDRHGVTKLPRMARTFGESREPDFDKAASLIRYRAGLLGMDDAQTEIYADICKSAAHNPEQMDELMDVLVEMDKASGVKYSMHVLTPHEIFYTGMSKSDFEKIASNVVFIGEVMVPVEVFGNVKEAEFQKYFNAEEAARFSGMRRKSAAEITDELDYLKPEGQRRLLDLLLKSAA